MIPPIYSVLGYWVTTNIVFQIILFMLNKYCTDIKHHIIQKIIYTLLITTAQIITWLFYYHYIFGNMLIDLTTTTYIIITIIMNATHCIIDITRPAKKGSNLITSIILSTTFYTIIYFGMGWMKPTEFIQGIKNATNH